MGVRGLGGPLAWVQGRGEGDKREGDVLLLVSQLLAVSVKEGLVLLHVILANPGVLQALLVEAAVLVLVALANTALSLVVLLEVTTSLESEVRM